MGQGRPSLYPEVTTVSKPRYTLFHQWSLNPLPSAQRYIIWDERESKTVSKAMTLEKATEEAERLNTPPPPLTGEQFIGKYRRGYVNYAALVEVGICMGAEAEDDYQRLSDAEMRKVVEHSKQYAANA